MGEFIASGRAKVPTAAADKVKSACRLARRKKAKGRDGNGNKGRAALRSSFEELGRP